MATRRRSRQMIAAPMPPAIARNGMSPSRYRASLWRIAESAMSGTMRNAHGARFRATHSSGSIVGAHQRAMFAMYHHGAWYFTRDAKSGATSVSRANRMTLANGAPQVIQSY